ncbi:monooxygenase [Diaporthe helianthi]|uniref:Monooxygenase n=1 Tax=Diaporthe helianthi TaxID=158607 RepID=A0A2P5HK27_DIAHE|nr:monooxygenase [Diaporthe helianthi]
MSLTCPMLPPRILIAGAGIGGLTTALTLHAAGLTDIHIFEAALSLTSLGVGINVQPSAVLILRNLGLLGALEKIGVETQELNFYNRHGDSILSEPRGKHAGYHVPQFSVHRGEFQLLLLEAVKGRLGSDRIHLGHALASWDQVDGGDTITAHFVRRERPTRAVSGAASGRSNVNPSGGQLDIPSMTGSLLVAADGINSTARRRLYPDEGPPRFSGRMLWRGCTERQPFLTGASMIWAGHANQKFIAYPIGRRGSKSEKSLVNWIAELRVREEGHPDTTPPVTDWTKSVDKSVFQGPFEGWTCGGLKMVEDLIEPTEHVYEFPMCDREPIDKWSFGRMTLLGDAAHAMYPIGSNGASQAIIDAETLASCLSEGIDDVSAALSRYQEGRLPPTAKIVYANRANGPDHVLQLAEERAPGGFDDVYSVIPKEELESIGAKYKAVAGFEMESVNVRATETEHLAARWV